MTEVGVRTWQAEGAKQQKETEALELSTRLKMRPDHRWSYRTPFSKSNELKACVVQPHLQTVLFSELQVLRFTVLLWPWAKSNGKLPKGTFLLYFVCFYFEGTFIKAGDTETRKVLGQERASAGCFGSLKSHSQRCEPGAGLWSAHWKVQEKGTLETSSEG